MSADDYEPESAWMFSGAVADYRAAERELEETEEAYYNLPFTRQVRRDRPFQIANAKVQELLDPARYDYTQVDLGEGIRPDEVQAAADSVHHLVHLFWLAICNLIGVERARVRRALAHLAAMVAAVFGRRPEYSRSPRLHDDEPRDHRAATSPFAAHAPPGSCQDVPMSTPAAVALAA